MKRRTLDLLVSAGGLLLAIILVVVGAVAQHEANFSKSFISQQFAKEAITFPDAASVAANPEEANTCLATYAGQVMANGEQAECYADYFIGLHLSEMGTSNKHPEWDGLSYAQMGDVQSDLKAQIADAQKASPVDQTKVDSLNADLTTANSVRTTLFQGEMLRGTLLSSYGFGTMGTLAGQAAIFAFIGAALLFILALFGFWHFARTPETVEFEPFSHTETRKPAATK